MGGKDLAQGEGLALEAGPAGKNCSSNNDPTQASRKGHSLEGDPVLQSHFLVRQHGAVLIQDQGLLQTPGRV